MEKTTQIYGIRAVIEAINSNEAIDKVFIQKGLHGDLSKELESLIRKKGIHASYVPFEKINRLSQNNHQGVVATISPIQFHNFEELVEKVMAQKRTPVSSPGPTFRCSEFWSHHQNGRMYRCRWHHNSEKRSCTCNGRYH